MLFACDVLREGGAVCDLPMSGAQPAHPRWAVKGKGGGGAAGGGGRGAATPPSSSRAADAPQAVASSPSNPSPSPSPKASGAPPPASPSTTGGTSHRGAPSGGGSGGRRGGGSGGRGQGQQSRRKSSQGGGPSPQSPQLSASSAEPSPAVTPRPSPAVAPAAASPKAPDGRAQRDRDGKKHKDESERSRRADADRQRAQADEDARKKAQQQQQAEEKRRDEEEKAAKAESDRQAKARAEAERAAAEEERKRREAEEERAAQLRAAAAKADEDRKAFDDRSALRATNSAAALNRDADASVRLDSSIKKCSAVLRKLKAITEHSLASIMADIRTVNLSKYISEVVAALCDTPLRKRDDIDKIVRVCSVMHERHEGFSAAMRDGVERTFPDVRGKSAGRRGGGGGGAGAAAAAASSGGSGAGPDGGVGAGGDGEEEDRKRRTMLRLLVEMYYVALTDDVRLILDVLADAMQKDAKDAAQSLSGLQSAQCSFSHLSLLLSFLRCGCDEFAQVTPRKVKELYGLLPSAASPPVLGCVPPEVRDRVRHMFEQYWALVSGRYATLTAELHRKEKRLLKMEVMRGDISEDMKKEARTLRDNWEKMHSLVLQMADALDRALPAIVEAKEEEDEDEAMSLEVVSLAAEEGGSGPYEDEEARAFYTQLLDLSLVVPPLLLAQDREPDEEETKHDDAQEKPSKPDAAAADPHERRGRRGGKKRRGDDGDEEMSIEELERKLAQLNEVKEEEMEVDDDASAALSGQQPIDAIFLSLRSAFSADAVDAVASRFAFLNTRANRTRLISHLLHLPRSSLSLLPFAARLVAILNQYHPEDVGDLLLTALLDEFFRLLRRKEMDKKAAYKVKNARFIAELVKFGVAPPSTAFRCWKACMLSWSKESVVTACQLMEGCGFYLYHLPATHARCALYMLQTRKVKDLQGPAPSLAADRGLMQQVDAALDACHPDAQVQPRRQRKQRHVMEAFVRQLVYADLNARTVDRVAVKLRKLPWNAPPPKPEPTPTLPVSEAPTAPALSSADASAPSPTAATSPVSPATSPSLSPSSEADKGVAPPPTAAAPSSPVSPPAPPHVPTLILKCLSSPHLVSYSSLPSLASLASLLCVHQPLLGVPLVDAVLEEIRVGLETNLYSAQQRRLTFVRYLAQLFLYRMFDVQVVFDTLYTLLFFGQDHSAAAGGDSRLDPAYDSFRLRLIVTLLDGVSSFFQGKAGVLAKRRLQRFLLYLVRYVRLKEYVAFEAEQALTELLAKLGESTIREKSSAQIDEEIAAREDEDSRRGGGKDEVVPLAVWRQRGSGTAIDAKAALTAPTAVIEEEDEEEEAEEGLADPRLADEAAQAEEAEEEREEGGGDGGDEDDEEEGRRRGGRGGRRGGRTTRRRTARTRRTRRRRRTTCGTAVVAAPSPRRTRRSSASWSGCSPTPSSSGARSSGSRPSPPWSPSSCRTASPSSARLSARRRWRSAARRTRRTGRASALSCSASSRAMADAATAAEEPRPRASRSSSCPWTATWPSRR